MQKIFVASLLVFGLAGSLQAAPNFNYSNINIQVGTAVFDNNLPIEYLDEQGNLQTDKHEKMLVQSAGLNYQFKTGLILGATHTRGASKEGATEIKAQTNAGRIGYAIGVREIFDIYARLNYFESEAQACLNQQNSCVKPGKTYSYGYDIGAVWAYSYVEYGINLSQTKFREREDDYGFGAHAALLFDRHSSLISSLGRTDKNTAITVGYRFSF